jgi:RND family efflux transporter MFP subunit
MTYLPTEPAIREDEQQTLADSRRRRRIARLLGGGALLTLALVLGVGAWGHASRRAATLAELAAQSNALPIVHTMTAKAESGPRTIDLPGNMAAFDSATLYARATGYISVRHVDIGSKVHRGDVLAVIAAPDLDQQLAQARAQLVQLQATVSQAQANAELGRVTDARTSRLVVQGWSSKQQGDQDRLSFAATVAAVEVAKANVLAQQAAVSRLEQLTAYEQVTAPFEGVITSRQIDVGSLVTADAASGTPLFSIARTDVLRVQVYVPQSDYFGIHDGDRATVTVPELPGRAFTGTVARNAQALADTTRTLLTEVDVDNANGALAAGLYGVVHLQVRRVNPVVLIPSQAVIFSKDGLSAGVVTDGKVELRALDLEADDGGQVEVRAGLKPGDRIILNPPVGATDGMRVRVS